MENTNIQLSKRIAMNSMTVLGLAITVFVCIAGYKAGLFTSADALAVFVKKIGFFGPIAFIGLQVVQVVIPIIPGGLGCLAGVILFGPVYGFIYNYIGICIGSVINFFLARSYGKPFVRSMVQEKTYNKYIGWLDKDKKFDKLFTFAMFFPLSPDDFLCMLAGLTAIKFKKFILIMLAGKVPSIIIYSLGLSVAFETLMGMIVSNM